MDGRAALTDERGIVSELVRRRGERWSWEAAAGRATSVG